MYKDVKFVQNSSPPRPTLGTLLLATAAQAQSSDEAKSILRRSREKCQSIQQGHYVMLWKMKYMSDKDTTFGRCTCDFKKLPKDTVYGKTFSLFEDYGNSSRHFLYTGNEFVSYGDTAGTVMTTCPSSTPRFTIMSRGRTLPANMSYAACWSSASKSTRAS